MFKKIDENNIETTTIIKKVESKEDLEDRLQHCISAIEGYIAEKNELEDKLKLLGEF